MDRNIRNITRATNWWNSWIILFRDDPSSNPDDVIQFINIESAGNATDFETQMFHLLSLHHFHQEQDPLKQEESVYTNSIEFVTISSQGNGTNFGDLTNPKKLAVE